MTETKSISVDINKATSDELTEVRGIGPSLAQRIIEDRPYDDLHELVRVPGINEIKLASLVPYLTIDKPTKKAAPKQEPSKQAISEEPIGQFGDTEAFLFLEDQKEREDALLIIFGGFILGLIILLLRRRNQ
jgi:hypothetical protein